MPSTGDRAERGGVTDRRPPFKYSALARVWFSDTDAQGIVYLIEAFVRVSRIGTTSMTYECAAYLLPADELMVTAELTVVLVDLAERRPAPIPDTIREAVKAFEGDDLAA